MAVLGGGSGGDENEGSDQPKKSKGGNRGKDKGNAQNSCFKVVKMIMERNFAPVIIFSFSKKECEGYALAMAKLDFNTRKLKNVWENKMNKYSNSG